MLDSLDLDIDTVERAKGINSEIRKKNQGQENHPNLKNVQEINEEIQSIKEMIGYESMLGSMDLQT